MQSSSDDSVAVTSTQNESDEVLKRLGIRGRRNVRKVTTLILLLRGICVSQEKCIEWLKNKGLIPRILFCPRCNNRMKFEANDQAMDGYVWTCKDCASDSPEVSIRHGSWLESRDYPLPLILLYTYLWAHGFTLEQISKETNLLLSTVKEWNETYCDVCYALYQRSMRGRFDLVDGNNLNVSKEAAAVIWRKKNQSKDLLLRFLRDADSL